MTIQKDTASSGGDGNSASGGSGKSKEQVKAERRAKAEAAKAGKAAKAGQKKQQGASGSSETTDKDGAAGSSSDAASSAGQKSQHLQQLDSSRQPTASAQQSTDSTDAAHKSKAQLKAERRAKQQQAAPETAVKDGAAGSGSDAASSACQTSQQLQQLDSSRKPTASAQQSTDSTDAAHKSKAQLKAERRAKQQQAAPETAVKDGAADSSSDAASSIGQKSQQLQQLDSSRQPTASAQQSTDSTDAAHKSKAQLKAERRAKQEAQRAAKAAASTDKSAAAKPQTAAAGGKPARDVRKPDAPAPPTQKNSEKKVKKSHHQKLAKKSSNMFSHLPQVDIKAVEEISSSTSVHPAMVRLGLSLAGGRVVGGSGSAVALLAALSRLVADYVTPPQRELKRHLPDVLTDSQRHLSRCRLTCIAAENVARRLEHVIRTEIPDGMNDTEAKQHIVDWIDGFIEDNICKAMTAITVFAGEKIHDGDVILTYGRSSLVLDVLLSAWQAGRRFRVVVLDSGPSLSGRRMLQQLLQAGLSCTYGLLGSVSLHVHQCSKLVLGVEALLSNGAALAAAGTAMLCLTARAFNRPVVICCETFKFSERVLTDALAFNELGDASHLCSSRLREEFDSASTAPSALSLLNLLYDVTTPDLIDVVITELGAIPCTSVPAVLRLQTHQVY